MKDYRRLRSRTKDDRTSGEVHLNYGISDFTGFMSLLGVQGALYRGIFALWGGLVGLSVIKD